MINLIQKLKKGDRIEFTRALDREPNATVMRGERGTVSCVDADGMISIKLEAYHPGLSMYDNCMWIEPAYAEDVHLKRLSRQFWTKSEVKVTLVAAAIALALALALDVLIDAHPVHASRSHCDQLPQPTTLHLVLAPDEDVSRSD